MTTNQALTVTIRYDVQTSPLGAVLVAATERGVCALYLGDDEAALVGHLRDHFPQAQITRDDDALHAMMTQVRAYLHGEQTAFDLPLDIQVTAFQQQVLDELQRIPYGATRTYGEIARAIGKPKAARAVGNACKQNPVPLVIPCHRVIRSDGTIDGYAPGTARKQQLLTLEGAQT